MRFEDQVVVVTGAGRGIGYETAKSFSEAGAKVVLIDIDGDRVTSSAAGLERAEGIGLDLSDERGVSDAVAGILARHGQIDVLANLAAIFPYSPIDEVSTEEWHRVIACNLDSTFFMCRAALPSMRERGYGRIVNISSGSVHSGVPGLAHYVASKAGVIGLSSVLAREAGADGVTVNCVLPGYIGSEFVAANMTPERHEAQLATQIIKRAGKPSEVADLIRFLADRRTAFITGQSIYIGGGISYQA